MEAVPETALAPTMATCLGMAIKSLYHTMFCHSRIVYISRILISMCFVKFMIHLFLDISIWMLYESKFTSNDNALLNYYLTAVGFHILHTINRTKFLKSWLESLFFLHVHLPIISPFSSKNLLSKPLACCKPPTTSFAFLLQR
jgi:hypothetical protein